MYMHTPHTHTCIHSLTLTYVHTVQDVEEHAVLLCSLLLGFGLDAYVVIGTKSKGQAHTWVMTLGAEEGGGVTFWESVTGQRYVQPMFDPDTQAGKPLPPPTHPYRTIGCVFNHQSFYANAQPSNAVSACRFDLSNESLWKAMSPEAIKYVDRQKYVNKLLFF